MKFRGVLAAAAAASLIAAPALAEASFDRVSAPVSGESANGGGGGVVLGVVAAVLIIGGIVIAAGSGDDEPISG